MAKHNRSRASEQAKALRIAETLPYDDLLDKEIVSSALAEEKLNFRLWSAPRFLVHQIRETVANKDNSIICKYAYFAIRPSCNRTPR
jgi:hypothetical protein